MDNTNLVLDIIVSILLAATIFATVTVNRRLNQLRESRDDLPRLLGAFNDATVRAEAGIPKLRRAAEEASVIVQERVEKAQLLRDDLAFMVERADSIANRLEDAVRQARAELKSSAPSSAGRLHAASRPPGRYRRRLPRPRRRRPPSRRRRRPAPRRAR